MDETDKEEVIRLVTRRVLAAMETGSVGEARTIVRELEEGEPAAAAALRADVVHSYGIFL